MHEEDELDSVLEKQFDVYDKQINALRSARSSGRMEILKLTADWFSLVTQMSLALGVGAVTIAVTKFQGIHGHYAFVAGSLLLILNAVWITLWRKVLIEDDSVESNLIGKRFELLFMKARDSSTQARRDRQTYLSQFGAAQKKLTELGEEILDDKEGEQGQKLSFTTDIAFGLFLFPGLLLASEAIPKIGTANYVWIWIVTVAIFALLVRRSIKRGNRVGGETAKLDRAILAQQKSFSKWVASLRNPEQLNPSAHQDQSDESA